MKEYKAKFPLEHSIVIYYVPKNKIKNKDKKVFGGSAVLLNDIEAIPKELKGKYKNIEEYNNVQIQHLFTNIKHEYLKDTLNTKKLTTEITDNSWEIKIK